MPSSVDEGKVEAIEMLDRLGILEKTWTVLDVGAGMGTWFHWLSPHLPGAEWDAIEVWQDWIDRYNILTLYDHVFAEDARTIDTAKLRLSYDLLVFGDVLEHMSIAEAQTVVHRLRGKVALLSIPMAGGLYEHQTEKMHDYGTGEDFPDCPYERHLSSWTPELVKESFNVVDNWVSPNMGVFVVQLGII